jgi:hypothetical protein
MTPEQHAKRLWNAGWDSGQAQAFLSLATDEFRACEEAARREVWEKLCPACSDNDCALLFEGEEGVDKASFETCPRLRKEDSVGNSGHTKEADRAPSPERPNPDKPSLLSQMS